MEKKKSNNSILLGAALLMATSAVGPGFLTQSATFTAKYMNQLAIIILLVIAMDIITQLNVWSIVGVSGKRAQDLANDVLPGLGYVIALLVAFGGLVFNIGNVGGVSLALEALCGIPTTIGCLLGGLLAICIFLSKNANAGMDLLAKLLGAVIIVVALFVAFSTKPPVGEITGGLLDIENPAELFTPMITILGGSCGGYISYSGAHRLLDAGISGRENLNDIRKGVLMGTGVSGVVRLLMFLATYGVCTVGGAAAAEAIVSSSNPAAEVFFQALGTLGYKLFAVILLCASMSSVVGAAYTSVSFLKTLHPLIADKQKVVTVCFIGISTCIMAIFGGAAKLLVLAGAVNGLILPVTLSVILLAGHKKKIVGDYKHNRFLTVAGCIIAVMTLVFGIKGISALF